MLANDTDVDGNTLTATVTGQPANGDLTLDANGSFTYTPDPGYAGADSFTYRANDGTANSNTATVTITVNGNNDPPVVDSVVIDQAAPATNDTLTGTVQSHDAEGDEVEYAYQWLRNGTAIDGATAATLDLSVAGNGDRGDRIALRVTPSDGAATGSSVTSAEVTVRNSPPSATVVLDNEAPITDDVLTATATRADADGDAVTLTYVWSVDGVVRKTTTASSSLTDTFDLSAAGNGDAGDVVTVRVTPSDGTGAGQPAEDAVTIAADPAPQPPSGLTATLTTSAVVLSWTPNAESYAAGYNVYRASAEGGPFVKLNAALLTTTTYSDAAAPAQAVSYYRVTAVNGAGLESPPATTSVSRGIALRATSSANNGGKTASLALPRPAGVIAGDVLVAVVDVRSTPAITPPQGWSLIRVENGGSALRQAVYVRVATANEPAGYGWAFSTAQSAAGAVLAYAGVNTESPVDASSGAGSSGSSSIVAPSLTTTSTDAAVVGLFGAASNATITAPTGLSLQAAAAVGGKDKLGTAAADSLQPLAGPSGSRTATIPSAAANVGQLVALRPANVIAAPDTQAPSTPAAVTATAVSSTQIDLTWTPATDNVGVARYEVFSGAESVGYTGVARFSATGLTPATAYTFTVVAEDAAGNRSPASEPAAATTLEPAAPSAAFRAASSAANKGTNTLVLSRPGAVRPGDVLLASIDVAGTVTLTPPTGWAQVTRTTAGTALTKATFVRVAATGDAASYTWTLSAARAATGVLVAYSGVDSSAPIAGSGEEASTGSGEIRTPSVSTTAERGVFVLFAGIATNASITPPGDTLERVEITGGSGPAKLTSETSDEPLTSPTGPHVARASKSAANVGHAVALRAAP